MKLINCILFTDGIRAYFVDDNRKDHVTVQPGDNISFPAFEHIKQTFELKVPYNSGAKWWAK